MFSRRSHHYHHSHSPRQIAEPDVIHMQGSNHESSKMNRAFMSLAIEEAMKSEYVDSAFCVGCVIVKNGKVISKGYSRELPGNTHAEQCALDKLVSPKEAEGADMYTTMEPCSERLSGNLPCVQRIITARIARVFQGVSEPSDFVDCVGTQLLSQVGIQVRTIPDFEEAALRIARGGGSR